MVVVVVVVRIPIAPAVWAIRYRLGQDLVHQQYYGYLWKALTKELHLTSQSPTNASTSFHWRHLSAGK